MIQDLADMRVASIILIFCCIALHKCQRIDCNWYFEYRCGNKCLDKDKACICGNETMMYSDTYHNNCCNYDDCIKDEKLGTVYCPGVQQNFHLPCQGMCKQDSWQGNNMVLCNDQSYCYLESVACLGMPNCKE